MHLSFLCYFISKRFYKTDVRRGYNYPIRKTNNKPVINNLFAVSFSFDTAKNIFTISLVTNKKKKISNSISLNQPPLSYWSTVVVAVVELCPTFATPFVPLTEVETACGTPGEGLLPRLPRLFDLS